MRLILAVKICAETVDKCNLQCKFDHSKGVALFGAIMTVLLLVASGVFAAALG